ncbi:hypothetical protein ACFQJC_09905 [Haloferax namakaokahaiae]|uniref:Uncharacterized protein n=1 Tax=Haloferax namakaokahaiae TaxID=1748331 RepID=A0ABD5ZFA8_9EURY
MEEPNSPYFRDQIDATTDDPVRDREVIIMEGQAMSLRAYRRREVTPY